MKVIDKLRELCKAGLLKTLNMLSRAVISASGTVNNIMEYRKAKERKTEIQKAKDAVENACDNGNIADLIDSTSDYGKAVRMTRVKAAAAVLIAVLVSGCQTINVQTVQPWEGRYTTVNAASEALRNAELRKNESIWILSNTTLKRTLTREQD